MAKNKTVINAIRRAAAALVGRPVAQDEIDRIMERIEQATGNSRERALTALGDFAQIPRDHLTKLEASPNVERAIEELKKALDKADAKLSLPQGPSGQKPT